jgi:hypothetical protein
VNAPAAARTYRIGGIQPYVMLVVLAACTVFAPVVLAHALWTQSWWELGWALVVVGVFLGALWRAAYRIDVRAGTVEFRSILWRRAVPLRQVRWIRSSPGFAVVRLRRGTVHVYGTVAGWDDFVGRVRSENRRVRVFRSRA